MFPFRSADWQRNRGLFILNAPALVKILLTFGLILGLSKRVPLAGCLFGGSVLIGSWMGLTPGDILHVLWVEATGSQTLWLALIITLILILSDLMAKSGQQARIVSAFQAVSPSPRFTAASLPALIGLLPMPGGALFSAPMVGAAMENVPVKPELKVAINYWFRHIWEFWWPLYPGIILAISLFSIEAWKLCAVQAPLTLGSVLGGIVFILPAVSPGHSTPSPLSRDKFVELLQEVMPILVVICVLFGLQGSVALAELVTGVTIAWPQYLSFVLALVTAIGMVSRASSMGMRTVSAAALNMGVLRMVLTVVGIMVFKGGLVQSGAIDQVRVELDAYQVPTLTIIALLPFIAGLVTGIAFAFVGVSFPLVVALVPEGRSPLPYAVLAYGFGFMGMMLSPLHLCLLVTKEYFRADLVDGYRYLWKPVLLCLIWTVSLYFIYTALLG